MGKYASMADRINTIKPGMALRISRHELRDLPGLPDWAAFADITTGFERVKESVIGSAHPHLWRFTEEMDGDITVYRLPQANTCETCGGSGEIDQFAGGGWPGQAMQFVDCPDCIACPKIRGTK